jgi:DNA-binding PadR family transcriptional regulator
MKLSVFSRVYSYNFWIPRQIDIFFSISSGIQDKSWRRAVKTLSSQEEILLLAVLALGDNAYGVTIRRHVSRVTGKEWSIGAIYDPLYRLEQKKLVRSSLSKPTQERGGRSKRIFTITDAGKKALKDHKRVRDALWGTVPGLALKK